MKIAILGSGALAIALSKIIEDKDHSIIMWTKFEDEKQKIETSKENTKLFPGVKIPEDLIITTDIKQAVIGAEIIINALPFVAIKDVIELLKGVYDKNQIILSTTKGLDEESFVPTTSIFIEQLGATRIAALSGPSFAIEIVKKENISFMLGGTDEYTNTVIKKLLSSENIQIEITDDIIGIQLAGGIKNAIAIGAGMLYGCGAVDSTRAAYLATGMTDMANLIVSLGGKIETTYSYAGVGDLILTCISPISRNFTFGSYVGQGYSVEQAFVKMNDKTVEGYKVIRALNKYAEKNNLKLRIIPALYDILFEGKDVKSIKKV